MRFKTKVKKQQLGRNQITWWPPQSRYWIAIGTLAACATTGSKFTGIAYAQPAQSAASRVASPTLNTRHFDIPAGPLNEVLDVFRDASGLQVLLPLESIGQVQSPGVSGVYTSEQALRNLLMGTNVSYRFAEPSTVTLEMSQVRETVVVTDRAPLTSVKYTEPLRDLPQTISVIPQSVIKEQGATTLSEVLRNVPGLTIAAGEGGAPAGDNLTLRGFSARNDVFVDGVRDLGPQSRDPFNLEQVEVIKGPQSAYTGRGSTGGSINLVSKQPNLNRYIGGSVMLGNASMQRLTGDINAPLEKLGLGERTAFRMNLLYHDAEVPGRDVTESHRTGLAPSILFGSGTPTRLTLNYFRMRQDNLPDYGIPWVPASNNALAEYRDRPAPVPRETFYGLRSRDFEKIGSNLGTVRFEHDFSDSLAFRNQFRYGRSSRDSITTAPRFASTESTEINRNGPAWLTEDKIVDNQADLRVNFSTGRLEHTVVTGLMLTREENSRQQRSVQGAPQTTLLNPNADDPFDGTIAFTTLGEAAANTQALYAFDTVKIGQHLHLNGGFRWERFDAGGVAANGNSLNRVDKMLSLRAGAVYKPVEEGSFYVSYGTSMNPSIEGLNYQPADATLEPEKTYTVEGGTKWDLLNERLSLSAAIFRVEKTNARTPGVLPDDLPVVLQGEQRVAGTEIGVAGFITRQWRLYGAYTFMHSKVLISNNPEEQGNELINTPPNSFNLWSTYQIKRLQFGGGLRFIDRRYGNTTNTRSVDSYWTADAMASYSFNKHLDLRLNLYNINDAYYFERLGGGHLIPGAGRAATVTTNFTF